VSEAFWVEYRLDTGKCEHVGAGLRGRISWHGPFVGCLLHVCNPAGQPGVQQLFQWATFSGIADIAARVDLLQVHYLRQYNYRASIATLYRSRPRSHSFFRTPALAVRSPLKIPPRTRVTPPCRRAYEAWLPPCDICSSYRGQHNVATSHSSQYTLQIRRLAAGAIRRRSLYVLHE
jgi:hypothetical protein